MTSNTDHPHTGTCTHAIVRAVLDGASEADLLADVCTRLNAIGLALVRVSIASNLLDPTFDARGVTWLPGEGAVDESFSRSTDPASNEVWLTSPFYALLESGRPTFRRRLDAGFVRGEFPLLDNLQDGGATDYFALAQRVGAGIRLGDGEGMIASWSTSMPGGFRDEHLSLVRGVMPALTLACMLHTAHRAARTLLATYLGSDAAERVLAGNIVRGRAEPIRAVVWFSDLVGFSRISDTTDAVTVLALLNEYAEAQVEEIEEHEGHVLKFMGDGILAIFPGDDTAGACQRALAAAARLRKRIVVLNARRAAVEAPVTDLHLALHVGELLYGNLGSPRRLDFTVLGAAVNMAARMEAMCGSLDQKVIVSLAFAEAAGEARSALVSLGRYALKGIARPEELFTLDVDAVAAAS